MKRQVENDLQIEHARYIKKKYHERNHRETKKIDERIESKKGKKEEENPNLSFLILSQRTLAL